MAYRLSARSDVKQASDPAETVSKKEGDDYKKLRKAEWMLFHDIAGQHRSRFRPLTVRMLPELYAHLNPMPFAAAVQMEMDLAEDLRYEGYTVTGGH